MREIKFRAWVEADSKLHAIRLIDFLPTGLPLAIRVCDPFQIDEDGNVDFDFSEYREGFTLEQYTGLHDKNGKEIYEGDILAGTLGTAGRGASTRREKPFNFKMMWYRDGWNLSAVDRYCSSTYRWYPNADDCTVIGNIHENPELLK